MAEHIELAVSMDDDGRPFVHDQHGRQLAGVRNLTVSSKLDDVLSVNVEAICYKQGRPVALSRYSRHELVGDQVVDVTTMDDLQ